MRVPCVHTREASWSAAASAARRRFGKGGEFCETFQNTISIRLRFPLRSHSDGRGEGQGEVRVPCVHTREASWSAAASAARRRFGKGGEFCETFQNTISIRLRFPLRSHSDGRGEGQGEVRVPCVHTREASWSAAASAARRRFGKGGEFCETFQNTISIRLLFPLRSHSDGRGEGQGEVRVPCVHTREASWSAAASAARRRFGKGGEFCETFQNTISIRLRFPLRSHSDGRGEGQGEVRVPCVHTREASWSAAASAARRRFGKGGEFCETFQNRSAFACVKPSRLLPFRSILMGGERVRER